MKIDEKTTSLVIKTVNLALQELKNDQVKDEGTTLLTVELVDLINIYVESVLKYPDDNIVKCSP